MPNCRQTVVLIGEHNADGALGVVLNRALNVTVQERLPLLGDLVPPGDPLFEGGPVQPASAVLLAEFAHGAQVVAVAGDFLFDLMERLAKVCGDVGGEAPPDAEPSTGLASDLRETLRADDDERNHHHQLHFERADTE